MTAMNRFSSFFMAWIFPWVPKRLLSRATGVFMRLPWPRPVRGGVVAVFAGVFGINVEEAELPPAQYRSLDAFFTRKLKSGLRPIEGERIHPVDGLLTQRGLIQEGELIQAKGWTYSVSEFLGDADLAHAYAGGYYATYYLCPADYHRVHAPVEGHMVSARHIPGLLWPVNDWSVTHIRRLFCLNERVVMNFESAQGKWSLVMVGATNVGHMSITPDPSIITNRWLWHAPTDRKYSPSIPFRPGDELGIFHLGSTVILLFEKSFSVPGLNESFLKVKMGQKVY